MAAVDVGPEEAKASSFEQIWNHEITALEKRRALLFSGAESSDPNTNATSRALALNAFGVGLSGGGIRSATLNLGILQGLANKGLLPYIDYLSTISGGGYIGTWLHSVIQRKNGGDPREAHAVLNAHVPGQPEDDPVAFLRKYSNYLAPKVGLFSADFWVIFTIWIRNMLLNLLILIPFLASLVTAAVILAPWMANGPHNSKQWTTYLCVAAFCLLLIAVVSSGLNLNAINTRQFASSEDRLIRRRVPVGVTLVSVLFASLAIFYGHWPATPDQVSEARPYFFAGLFLLLFTMQATGGFINCFRTTHPKRQSLFILHLIWMPAFAAAAGTLLFCTALLIIGEPGGISAVVWGTPLIMLALMATVSFHIGLMGADFLDASREWLARIGSILLIVSSAWLVFFLIGLYGPFGMAWLGVHYGGLALAMIVLWLSSTIFGVSAGTSSSTGAKPGEQKQGGLKETLLGMAPTVFAIGLLILIAGGVHHALGMLNPGVIAGHHNETVSSVASQNPSLTDKLAQFFNGWFAGLQPFVNRYLLVLASPGTREPAWLLFAGLLGTALFLPLRFNINEFSIHHFYKNRLVRCYLGAGNAKKRKPNRFTGFDSDDDINIASLSALAEKPYLGPYPIIGTTLNLNAGSELAQQERKAASFIFSPLYCGFEPARSATDRKEVDKPGSRMYADGYARTSGYFTRCGPDIGTAMAISGAAASPNWGYHTSAPVAFLLTFFNVRLGWWTGNPRIKPLAPPFDGLAPSKRSGPMYGFLWLIWELLGQTTGRSRYVNLSDGGHFENLGLYELVRRRCRYIIIGDGEQDGDMTFESLGGAIRKCRADFGVEIGINVEPIRATSGRAHCVVGTISYPEIEQGEMQPLTLSAKARVDQKALGWLVYFKASMTGDEPEDVKQHRAAHGDFPQESTLNQFFTESQFESYRRLGLHIVEKAFENIDTHAMELSKNTAAPPIYTSPLMMFQNLAAFWYPGSNTAPEKATELANAYSSLMKLLAKDADLAFLDTELLSGVPPCEAVALTPAIKRKTYFFVLELVQLMENVWLEFGMEADVNRDNPKNGGWISIFRKWCRSPTVTNFWEHSREGYNRLFQKFFDDMSH